MTHFPPNTHGIYPDAESHGTVLTCVCGRWGGARSFTFEDLCFPLGLSELFDRINRLDHKLCCFNMDFSCEHACSYFVLPAYEEMRLTVFETIVRSRSPDTSLVCLCLSLCLSPSRRTRALNCRCLFPLDTFRAKLKRRETEWRKSFTNT